MSRFTIKGGKRLSGEYTVGGNKNAVLPMLAACTLTDDVRTMIEILRGLGVAVERKDHTVTLCARGLRRGRLSPERCRQVRSSILFAGPLAARLGRATLFPPGGDIIGRRRVVVPRGNPDQ